MRLMAIILRTFFKLLYHQLAWAYDIIASIVSLGAWQKWVQAISTHLEGGKILEIGFGPGHLQVMLHKKDITVFGLDESYQMVQIAQKRLKSQGFQPCLARGIAQTLPFGNDMFQQVVLTFPAEFILQPASISEIHRVLVQQGEALIVPIAWITGRKPWERLIAFVNRISGEAPEWNPKVVDPLTEAGFKVGWEMINFPGSKIILIHMIKV